MKIVMVMYDTLNRHHLPNYGCDWTHAPNFQRLGERTVTFDRSYVCSMPCMPARYDLHTGRPNFLHRGWGPIEPWSDSVYEVFKKEKIYSHLTTDHYHYFEDGGLTFHQRYNTWQFNRGQEGDPWIGQVGDPAKPEMVVDRGKGGKGRQDWVNRANMRNEADHYQTKTFRDGLEFMRRNRNEENWVLQVETFDPHEPYFSSRRYKDLYAKHYDHYQGRHFDWPPYTDVANIEGSPEEIEHARFEYASLLSQCDANLGDVLSLMDEQSMWDDTMLIVWTDHGFFLGEKEMMGKCWMPFYEEVSHTPFFVWDPRTGKRGERRQALVQPSIDIAPTMMGFMGVEPGPDVIGKDLAGVMADDTPVREAGIFGMHGAQVNVTDGRYVYMRGPANEDNQPLYDYTMMPTHMTKMFDTKELQNIELAEPFSFMKGCRPMKIPTQVIVAGGRRQAGTHLFDLKNDPWQEKPIEDAAVEQRMIDHMVRLMKECDAPVEQYERLGLSV